MVPMKRALIVTALFFAAIATPAFAATTSVFTSKPDDPKAAYVQDFGAKGDGKSEIDSAALRRPPEIKWRATRLGGTVFIPACRYRLTRTVFVWDAVRLIGYGATRPVFVLADNTPGFQKGVADMVLFSGDGPARPEAGRQARRGATARCGTGESRCLRRQFGHLSIPRCSISISRSARAIRAAGVRFRVAQHGVLSHMDFTPGFGFGGDLPDRQYARICISTAGATASSPKRPRPPGSSR